MLKLLRLTPDEIVKRFGVTERCAKRWYHGIRDMNEVAALRLEETFRDNIDNALDFVSMVRAGNIRGAKTTYGFTSKDIADIIGSTKNTVHDIIRGRKVLQEKHLAAMTKWLDTLRGEANA